jgi:hypothetical protein
MPSFYFKKIVIAFALVYSPFLHAQNLLTSQSEELRNLFFSKDSLFKTPFIDADEWRDKPVKHRYVHGGFTGTGTRFSFYFPVQEDYKGHFFQYITPFPDNENLSQGASGEDDKISFCISHGAYFIETNGGGKIDFSKPSLSSDPSIGAYRANAAAAQFSKAVAVKNFWQPSYIWLCFWGQWRRLPYYWRHRKYRRCVGWCCALCGGFANGYTQCVFCAYAGHAHTV